MPLGIVHALDSFGPEVKKVIKSRISYPPFTNLESPVSLRPIDSRKELRSSMFSS